MPRVSLCCLGDGATHGENNSVASTKRLVNPLPPSDARLETEYFILEDLFSSVFSK